MRRREHGGGRRKLLGRRVRPRWIGVWVLARRDQDRAYESGNCYWRLARSEKEARMGAEAWIPDEPDTLPTSEEDRAMRASLPAEQRETFDIWHRIRWRARVSEGWHE